MSDLSKRLPFAMLFLGAMLVFGVFVYFMNQSRIKPHFTNISKMTTFVETVDEDSRTLLKQINDMTVILDRVVDEPYRIKTEGYDFIDIEMFGGTPYRFVLWAGYSFYDETGRVIGVRDSHHQLLASPNWDEPDPDVTYRDLYKNVLARPGTDSFSLFLGINRARENEREQLITELGLKRADVYGKKTRRTRMGDGGFDASDLSHEIFAPDSTALGDTYRLSFPQINDSSNITGRGATFDVSNVENVFVVKSDHTLRPLEPEEDYLIGSMSVQAFAVKQSDGSFQVFYFDSADMIELSVHDMTLSVTVYDYHVRERTTRGSRHYPDETGTRIHPNLAVTDKLPHDFVTVRVVNSDTISFPLWQPRGHLAALAITEHADYNGVDQDNLVMYGNIEGRFESGMGIIGNDIPFTKSVFAINTSSTLPIRNPETGESVLIRQSNIDEHQDFREQLKGYAKYGFVEIGPHCLGNGAKDRKTVEGMTEILRNMKTEYGATNWVDHGGIECLWETGWNPESKHYLLPALKSNGFRYLSAREDKFSSRLSLIKDNEPGNILFYVPRFDDDLTDDWKAYHYTTSDFVISERYFSKEHFAKIVEVRGFQNMHSYFPLQVLTVIDGQLAKAPWYETALENLADMRDQGDIYLDTSSGLMDYVRFVRDIDYVGVGNEIRIFNPDLASIKSEQPTFGIISLTGDKVADIQMVPSIELANRTDKDVLYVYPDP